MSAPQPRRDDFPTADTVGYRPPSPEGADDLDAARGIAVAVVIGIAVCLTAWAIACGFGFCH